MKNTQYLKQYVEKHPDNKMAWYLLGKEYKKNGQEGKANYCFNQAGGVFEAFEQSRVPADMLRDYEEGLLRRARERAERTSRNRKTLLGLALLLLALLPAGAAAPGPESAKTAAGGGNAQAVKTSKVAEGKQSADQPEAAADAAADLLRFTARETGAEAAAEDVGALLGGTVPGSRSAVLGMQRSGKWLIWQGKLPVEYTIDKDNGGRTVIQSYNAASCNCEPPADNGSLTKQGTEWQERQEQLAALWSAMNAYRKAKGEWPETLKDLTGNFPGNWLSGTSPLIEQAFEPMKTVAEAGGAGALQGESGNNAGITGGTQPSTGRGSKELPFLSSPLTILVDKQKHRLAVASGGMIVRSYEVGLGGDETPTGTFVITDKVVSPNGHDNGEFGSRGMQLSATNYAIHGTNDPASIGKDESKGCIRMKRKDIEELFDLVPKGTAVQIAEGGLLPDMPVSSDDSFKLQPDGDQTNPRKVYHWLD